MNDRLQTNNPEFDSLVPAVPFSRRGFLASSVAAGFAVSAGPLMAQTMIVTPMDGLVGGDIKIPTNPEGAMPGYYAAPKTAGKHPVILVVGEIWGVHEHIKDVCRRLAKAGYFAIANEPYWKIGELWKLTDIKEVIAGANKLPDEQAFHDLDTTVAWAAKQANADTSKLGITGFCRGGRMAWMYTTHSKQVKAGVAWYGGLSPALPAVTTSPIDVVGKLNAPVLGLYGGADQGIPLEQIEKLRANLPKHSTVHVYEGMPHAFNADYRATYRKEAAEDGWKRMLDWFKKHGVA
jgi:carboxymethylenebutenolidase